LVVSIEMRRRRRREPLHDRKHPPQLLLLGDRLGARTGRLAAHVEDRRALGRQPPPVLDGRVRVEEQAAVRERVGRHVDDAHDHRGSHQTGVSTRKGR
jgi:hypothetical protein